MLLNVKGLGVRYGTLNNARNVVSDVNLSLDSGEILSIVGESGSGKTTVIRAILGCLPEGGSVSSGEILFDGANLRKLTPEQWRKIRVHGISMIFQDSGSAINPIRTVGSQFIDYIRANETGGISKSAARERALKMLASVSLPDPDKTMSSYPFELSGGMRQRVGIAMAMTFSPKLLLADEPTSALDATTQAQIIRQIVDVRDKYKVAVILVTHNLGVAAYVSNKVMVMKNGRVLESGPRESVLGSPIHEYTKQLLSAVPVLGQEAYYAR